MADQDITQLLSLARDGDPSALESLLPLIYDQLHALARAQRRRQSSAETLNTTALVHEAYEKLAHADGTWNDRSHFFRVAARAMRQILVDYARRQQAAKRGGKHHDLQADEAVLVADERTEEVLALDEALSRLIVVDERQGKIVELRYFVGLTIPETAEALALSTATVKREWTAARAWLHASISSAG